MKKEMITFEQFIKTYNFKVANENFDHTNYKYSDTTIIRIYYGEEFKHCWFEFGIYDWAGSKSTWESVKKVLNKEIYQSYIDSIHYDDELDMLCIYLEGDN